MTVIMRCAHDAIVRQRGEFAYRINRSQSKNTIWHNSIIRMIQNKPVTWNDIKQNLT
jgi:hypothetical protein